MLVKVDHRDVTLRTFILFVQTAHAVLKYADAHFYRKAGLSTIKFIVLQVLASNGGTVMPSEIAEWTHREKHNITAERSNRDKRFVNITLTDKGRKVLKETMLTAQDIIKQGMSSIGEGDALLLEQSPGILRQNAHKGLEEAARISQTQPGRII